MPNNISTLIRRLERTVASLTPATLSTIVDAGLAAPDSPERSELLVAVAMKGRLELDERSWILREVLKSPSIEEPTIGSIVSQCQLLEEPLLRLLATTIVQRFPSERGAKWLLDIAWRHHELANDLATEVLRLADRAPTPAFANVLDGFFPHVQGQVAWIIARRFDDPNKSLIALKSLIPTMTMSEDDRWLDDLIHAFEDPGLDSLIAHAALRESIERLRVRQLGVLARVIDRPEFSASRATFAERVVGRIEGSEDRDAAAIALLFGPSVAGARVVGEWLRVETRGGLLQQVYKTCRSRDPRLTWLSTVLYLPPDLAARWLAIVEAEEAPSTFATLRTIAAWTQGTPPSLEAPELRRIGDQCVEFALGWGANHAGFWLAYAFFAYGAKPGLASLAAAWRPRRILGHPFREQPIDTLSTLFLAWVLNANEFLVSGSQELAPHVPPFDSSDVPTILKVLPHMDDLVQAAILPRITETLSPDQCRTILLDTCYAFRDHAWRAAWRSGLIDHAIDDVPLSALLTSCSVPDIEISPATEQIILRRTVGAPMDVGLHLTALVMRRPTSNREVVAAALDELVAGADDGHVVAALLALGSSHVLLWEEVLQRLARRTGATAVTQVDSLIARWRAGVGGPDILVSFLVGREDDWQWVVAEVVQLKLPSQRPKRSSSGSVEPPPLPAAGSPARLAGSVPARVAGSAPPRQPVAALEGSSEFGFEGSPPDYPMAVAPARSPIRTSPPSGFGGPPVRGGSGSPSRAPPATGSSTGRRPSSNGRDNSAVSDILDAFSSRSSNVECELNAWLDSGDAELPIQKEVDLLLSVGPHDPRSLLQGDGARMVDVRLSPMTQFEFMVHGAGLRVREKRKRFRMGDEVPACFGLTLKSTVVDATVTIVVLRDDSIVHVADLLVYQVKDLSATQTELSA